MSLVKYNNNSISAVTAAAAIPSGAMTHIKTLTASSSSTLSFVHGSSDVVLDSTYPIYQFEFINMHPATNTANFTFNLSTDSGSNYNVTKTTTWFQAYHKEDDSGAGLTYEGGQDLAQSTAFQVINYGLGTDNDENCSGTLQLFSPSSSVFVKHFIATTNNSEASGYSVNGFMAGYGNTTSVVNAVQFKMSSGNIDAGKIKLYGIKDS
jgi:hypothetical protein|nr:hypothetical protein [uncultured Mediterranean phage uvMED]